MTKPIRIGDREYIGSVITKKLEGEHKLIAGVPAKVLNDLDDDEIFLVETKPRQDMPDEIDE